MIRYNRIIPHALAVSLFVQGSLLCTVGYLGCGSPSPADGMPTCAPYVPPAIAPILPSTLATLAKPGIWIIPEFYLGDGSPGVLQDWGWLLTVAVVNVVVWTSGIVLCAALARHAIRAHSARVEST